MRRLAVFVAAIACAFVAAPSTAAPSSYDFSIAAQSDETTPNPVAVQATTETASTVPAFNRASSRPMVVAPVYLATYYFVGHSPARIELRGDRRIRLDLS